MDADQHRLIGTDIAQRKHHMLFFVGFIPEAMHVEGCPRHWQTDDSTYLTVTYEFSGPDRKGPPF